MVHGNDEGVPDSDRWGRFFSFRSDEQMVELASADFEVVDFHTAVAPGSDAGWQMQASTLRRPADR